MRIAIVNRSDRIAGGIETYIDLVAPALIRRGHAVGLWIETEAASNRPALTLPQEMSRWCASTLGADRAFALLRAWRPDVLYIHSLEDPTLEKKLLQVAPGVFFAHQYHGTCVSGTKMFKRPVARTCSRTFGWPCLLHYYPYGCGGLNPLTMLREYARQAERLDTLPQYQAVVTHSEHMFLEYAKHGYPSDRLHKIPFPVRGKLQPVEGRDSSVPSAATWRLLFVGRMERLKGGDFLLAAMPRVCASLDRHIQLTLAGDGRDRARWERIAGKIVKRTGQLTVEFVGWKDETHVGRLYTEADLLVVPSLWPEPFGMVGTEAGFYGVPAAAFAVGGVSEWLTDGVNGYLAPGSRPSAAKLGDAIISCLEDPAHHNLLRRGAREQALRFNTESHLSALLDVFESIESDKDRLHR